MNSDLFREEVLDAHAKNSYGEILLAHPTSHTLLSVLGLGLLLVIVFFLAFGSYTKRTTVSGVLEPAGGVAKVYAGRIGRLKVAHVREAGLVHKGEVLLEFTSEHEGATGLSIEAQSEAHGQERLNNLRRELQKTLEINEYDDANARDTLRTLLSTQENIAAQIRNQSARIQAAQGMITRYEELQKSGFIPEIQVQEKRNDIIEQRVRLEAMQRDLIGNEAEILRVKRNIASAPTRAAIIKAQIQRNISLAVSDLATQKNMHDWSITAPCDGTVGTLAIKVGQTTDANTPVISIVPTANALQATLYASSRALGFIQVGQQVKIKLDAFPYQKFGFVTGKILMIADTPVLSSEISSATRMYATGDKTEPQYMISVALDAQTISAYGKAQSLRPGMQITADIEIDRRRLFEWVLEPLFTMKRS